VSARPFVPRLSDEDLDLLLSRSLDGDLSPEEEHDLETLLAHDPAAARRKGELERLVAEARALPAPAPPFALATRVNSNVSEKAGHGGSVFHRFGFYPPPGMAVGAMALLGIVAVAITVLRPAPVRVAQRVEGPVDVFLTDGNSAAKRPQTEAPKVASKETARDKAAAASAAPALAERERAPAAVIASAPERKLEGRLGGKSDDKPADAEKVESQKKLNEQQPASVIAANELASEEREAKQAKQRQKLSKTEADAGTAQALRQAAPAPALDAAGGRAASLAAPGAKASGALSNAEPARAWSVVVRGEGARRWMLRRAPEGRPSVASAQASAFRITLDAEGRVSSVRALDARPVQPALLEFVRGLVFAPIATVTDGILRDEKAKDDRADAAADRPAEQPSEIEVEISTR
jgi:hypothetical protein